MPFWCFKKECNYHSIQTNDFFPYLTHMKYFEKPISANLFLSFFISVSLKCKDFGEYLIVSIFSLPICKKVLLKDLHKNLWLKQLTTSEKSVTWCNDWILEFASDCKSFRQVDLVKYDSNWLCYKTIERYEVHLMKLLIDFRFFLDFMDFDSLVNMSHLKKTQRLAYFCQVLETNFPKKKLYDKYFGHRYCILRKID